MFLENPALDKMKYILKKLIPDVRHESLHLSLGKSSTCACQSITLAQVDCAKANLATGHGFAKSPCKTFRGLGLGAVEILSNSEVDGKLKDIWMFPKIGGFPPNHPFLSGFPFYTIHFGVPLFLETSIYFWIRFLSLPSL